MITSATVSYAGRDLRLTDLPRIGRDRIRIRAEWDRQDWRLAVGLPKAEDLVIPGEGIFSVLLESAESPVRTALGHWEFELNFVRVYPPPTVHAHR